MTKEELLKSKEHWVALIEVNLIKNCYITEGLANDMAERIVTDFFMQQINECFKKQ